MTRDELKKTKEFETRLRDKCAEAGGTTSPVSKATIAKYVLDEMMEEIGTQHKYIKM